ncbi:MAG: NOP5/NOP56 family protein [Candidatus Nanoarchaeia archaeon]|nr:NOP5/NOP56 family protein [Candidatus Nanoarchaeia archaeon]
MKSAVLFEKTKSKVLEKGELYSTGLNNGFWGNKTEYAKQLNSYAVNYAKKKVKEATARDFIVSKAVGAIEGLNDAINSYYNRLRDLLSGFYPEAIKEIKSPEELSKFFIPLEKDIINRKLNLYGESMGADMNTHDKKAVLNSIKTLDCLILQRKELINYVEKEMSIIAPNLAEIAGGVIGAKLMSSAGGLENLAKATASRIQVIGAEKAMFRHLKQGAKPPKYGLIMHHPLISEAPREMKGRLARTLSSKIAICVKVDFYSKGKNVASDMKKELEKRGKK